MLPFDQKTDMYRPLNRQVHYPEVDIVRTLKNENPTTEDVIEKIQKITLQRSLRISEFMRDYDPLRSGSITKTQFLESLSMLHLYLSRQEAELLCEKYANLTPGRENEILWTKFADDIDIVFVVKHLEQRNDINEVLDITKKDFKLNEFLVILVTLFISALASKFLTTKTISISSANLVHNTSPSFSGLAYLSHNS